MNLILTAFKFIVASISVVVNLEKIHILPQINYLKTPFIGNEEELISEAKVLV
jgi:hypothetical protein